MILSTLNHEDSFYPVEILNWIAEGSSGCIYEGRLRNYPEKVAVKLIKGDKDEFNKE
ncbi:6957_t:CDS:1, partial [Gigaspora rosea]